MAVSNNLSMQIIDSLRPKLGRIGSTALIIGVIGLLASVAGAILLGEATAAQFFRSWLFSFMFWFGITGGCLAWLMMHHTTGGGWGFIVRRPLEAATRVIPLMIVFFVPIIIPMLLGQGTLYPWADPAHAKGDEVLQAKAIWLNVPGFVMRAALYLTILLVLAFFFNKWSRDLDEQPENREKIVHRLSLLGPPGLILYALTLTGAGVDWVMSQDPHWYSSLFGGLIIAGQALAAMSFLNVMIGVLSKNTDLLKMVPRKYLGDLGNFNMAFTLLWAYLNYSQWLIIYSANVSEETVWFLQRMRNGWQYMAGALIFIQFVLPFLTLAIGTNIKREPHRLKYVAGLILFMRAVDLFWFTQPSHRTYLSIHWLDIATFAGIGGMWMWMWTKELSKATTWVPENDVRLHGEWPPHEDHGQAAPRSVRGGEEGGFESHAGVEMNRPVIGGSETAGGGVTAHG